MATTVRVFNATSKKNVGDKTINGALFVGSGVLIEADSLIKQGDRLTLTLLNPIRRGNIVIAGYTADVAFATTDWYPLRIVGEVTNEGNTKAEFGDRYP